MAEAKLYVIPGSHPSRTAMLMLDRKGIPYKRVDLMPVISKGILKTQRFSASTVPALKLDGRRVQGSMEIGRGSTGSSPSPLSIPPTRSSGPRSRRRRPGAMSSRRSRAA